jgi:Fe-S cluster assembly protein SufD
LARLAPAAVEPEWLSERRRKGASLAHELPLPSQKQKGWEFTNLTELDLDRYEPGPTSVEGLDGDAPAEGDAIVLPLREAVELHPDLVGPRLGSIVAGEDPFVARNDAAWSEGVLVYVPRGVRLEQPVQLVIEQAAETSGHWRALVVIEEDAEAEVWERYESPEGSDGVFNAVVELAVGQGANLRYICEQELSEHSWVFATQRAEVERDGALEWVALGFGSARGKVRMETKLAGTGSTAKVTGAMAGTGRQHLDYDTTQEHAGRHTTSDLSFRGVLGDRATSVWRGMIRVDPGAQQTDAFQESRNLLLSKHSHADAIPGLEIEADDVRCTHAAAVAQVDAEQLYYLRTRGLAESEAKRLVIDGFLQELVERAPEGEVRERLAAALERRLEELLESTAPEPAPAG